MISHDIEPIFTVRDKSLWFNVGPASPIFGLEKVRDISVEIASVLRPRQLSIIASGAILFLFVANCVKMWIYLKKCPKPYG